MQQFFLAEMDWANGFDRLDIEEEYLKMFEENIRKVNEVKGTEDRQSIFLVEAMFQRLQFEYYHPQRNQRVQN